MFFGDTSSQIFKIGFQEILELKEILDALGDRHLPPILKSFVS